MIAPAADALVVVHFGFTSFVIFGGFLTWRWRRVMLLHLPALAWGCWVELSSSICPLTPLENYLGTRRRCRLLRRFLAHYLSALLYPVNSRPTFSGCWRGRSSWLTGRLGRLLLGTRASLEAAGFREPAEPFRQPAFLDPATPLPENPRPSSGLPVPR